MYYENYILINIEIPNFEEIKKKYFDNDGNKIVLLNDNYSIQSPFEYITPVMYSDPDGCSPEWWQWLLSGAAVVAGVALSATGIGGVLGGVLIGAGAGSIVNGYVNEANGGSFTAGYWGGAISGALCGVGAGIGGLAFVAASKATNIACIGYLTTGCISSFAGGFFGNLFGTTASAFFDKNLSNIDWIKTLKVSSAVGGLNIIAGIASGASSIIAGYGKRAASSMIHIANIGKYSNANVMIASRLVAGGISSMTEGVYDAISFLISLIM